MTKRFWLFAATSMLFLVTGCSDDSDSAAAQNTTCGNSIIDENETCDDGNTDSKDGCSERCKIEKGWSCPDPGRPCKETTSKSSECGNGVVESDETCDDKNTNSGDGCSANCQTETGWKCPEPGVRCTELPQCGNGIIEDGEDCDDNNTNSNDGCSDSCQLEEGWICPIEGQPCASTTCGDGKLDSDKGEDCDDGPQNVEYGGFNACGKNCQIAHFCGDGRLDTIDIAHGEECDSSMLDTSNQYNGCTTDCKRSNYCGDGIISHDEKCDDGNETNNDGCSSSCMPEDGFICTTVENTSKCIPILCGNGVLDLNETCDDGNRISGDGCSASCLIEKSYQCVQNENNLSVCTSTIGNGIIDKESGEECDDGNTNSGDGCSDHGTVEPGYVCEQNSSGKSVCYAKTCSDGILAGSEECDDGNDISGDGCSKQCKREPGYHCPTPGKACEKDFCGDGLVTGDETCDEGQNKTDGCVQCQIQPEWQCLQEGLSCTHDAVCGNGKLEGAETCEETNECCASCAIQPFCLCDSDGKNCKKGSCGNNILEYGEECDDGNLISGDGCSQICETEPIFTCDTNGCKPVCGDGLVLDGVEECDDGNLISGDGCSSQCKREEGFTCEVKIASTPGQITLPIIYRDFIRYTGNSGSGDGFVSEALFNSLPSDCKAPANGGTGSEYRYSSGGSYPLTIGRPSPDFYSYCPDSHCLDAVKPMLGTDGKPDLNTHAAIDAAVTNRSSEGAYNGTDGSKCIWLYTCPDVFKWWYKDVSGINKRVDSSLTLTEDSCEASVKAPGTYCYANSSFWPIPNDQGYGARYSSGANTGEFTSEFQTYFKYNGGERLIFNGDDDVWVFFNSRLGVDVGGIHPAWTREITLDTATAAEKFHMYPGGIYPLSMFHAERCTGGSSFRLTLAGFVAMGKSTCDSICGDDIIRGNEQCDLGNGHVSDEFAQMSGCVNCQLVPKCGNGKVETGEVCDAGHLCKDSNIEGCSYHADIEAQGCTTTCQNPNCNNGSLEAGEMCDCKDGACLFANAADDGKHCLNCKISGCGDGIVDKGNGEECDDGNTSDEDMCTSKCNLPFCGDGVVSTFLGEVCDDGKNDGSYGGCGLGCAYRAPYCGDGIVDELNEVCDDSKNDGSYGGCMPGCKERAPFCGDGIVQTEFESCDPNEPIDNAFMCSNNCSYEIN